MSGSPYTYSRGMAIAQLMVDRRRPIIKELAEKKRLPRVYLFEDDLFTAYEDSVDWVPKLTKLTRYGREVIYIWSEIQEVEGQPYNTWGGRVVEPLRGWPTEEEIAACIQESAEREKAGGSLSTNDIEAMRRLLG